MAVSKIYLAVVLVIIGLSQNSWALGPIGEKLIYLVPHNLARARQLEPPLVWNNTLAEYARAYAKERSVDCALVHSNYLNPGYGENIAMSDGELTPAEAIKLWIGEKPFYDYGHNACKEGEMCGHYTQVVWKGTKSMGCASTKCLNGGTFITCNYYPPGNYIGERPY